MADGPNTRYSQLSDTIFGVKLQQDQYQKSMEIITQQLAQLSEAVKEILAVLPTKPLDNNNRVESSVSNGGKIPIPKQVRLEFPKFDGEDPTGWIYKANQYFKYYEIPNHERILMASYYMEGPALVWFQDAEHDFDG